MDKEQFITELLLEADSYGLKHEVIVEYGKLKALYPEESDEILWGWAFDDWVK
jgi:hypothetical protein